MKGHNHIVNILLIEDSPYRQKLILKALKRAKLRCRLHSVGVGKDATRYLKRSEPFREAPRPDLVLFDLSQPGKGYLKSLDELISGTQLAEIPFALLTSSETEQLLEDQFQPTGSVMFSPINLDKFLKSMNSLPAERFLKAVTLIAKIGFVLIRVPKRFTSSESLTLAKQAC